VTRLRRAALRAGWGISDQALSSLTNFALGLLVAHSVDVIELGAFSLAFSAYLFSLNVSRALVSEPLGVRFANTTSERWRQAVRAATGLAIVIGLMASVICLVVGSVVGGHHGRTFIALALFMPFLLVQDCWRFAFFAAGRGRQAFLNDLVWALALVPALAALLINGTTSVELFMLAWGGAASVAAVAGGVQAGVMPRPLQSTRWLRQQGDLTSRYLVEFVVFSGSMQLYLYGIGALAGLAAVGSIRAAQILLGPLNVLTMGIGIVAVPEAVRALAVSLRRLLATALLISGVLMAGVLAWGMIVLLAPMGLGPALLGSSWEPARQVLPPLVVMSALNTANTGAFVALRALAAVRRSVRARLFSSACFVTGAVGGAALGGAKAAAWGLAIAAGINDVVWWHELRAALHDHRAASAEPRPGGTSGIPAAVDVGDL
jgi:O-antigen/teichoic acid export membrane protein